MKFRFVFFPDDDPQGNRHPAAAARSSQDGIYGVRAGGIVRITESGRAIPVANFGSRIVRDVVLDDGEGQLRQFGIEAELAGRH